MALKAANKQECNQLLRYILTPVPLLMAVFPDAFSSDTPQEESLTYQGQLDGLEAELLKYRAELNSVQSINSNALQSKEEAKVGCYTGDGFIC